MKLNITRPLVIFDLETTGLDIVNDRIIQLSYIKVEIDGTETSVNLFVNPEKNIPIEVQQLTHITNEMVRNEKTFKQLAETLYKEFSGCDFAGFNSNRFDIPMLAEEFLRAGVDVDLRNRRYIDVQNIFHKREERTLVAAYRFYCNKELGDAAHGAEADTLATYEVLLGQLERYEDLQNDVDFLSEYSTRNRTADFAGRIGYDDKEQEIFTFGKYKGRVVAEIFEKDPSYYDWMMNGDFPQYTKKIITEIKLRSKKF